MAVEPVLTSNCYSPVAVYTPPVGRVPVLGKVRAQIDQLRVSIADSINQMKNRDAAAADAALKTIAENRLLNQKAVTELAQTSNFIPIGTGLNVETVVAGIIEKQKGLFQKQTDGFDRDAEQKLAKIMVDTWSVRQSTDGTADSAIAGLNEAEIRTVLNKVRSGVSIPDATPLA